MIEGLSERAELQAVLDQVPEQHRAEFAQAARKIVVGSVQANVKKAVVLEALRASIVDGQNPAREQIQLSSPISLTQYLQKPSSEATGTSVEQLLEGKASPGRESLKQEWQKLSEEERLRSAASVRKALQNEAQIQKNTGLTEKEILKAAIATGLGKPLPEKWQKLSISEAQDWQDLISVNVTSPTNDTGWENFAALPMIEEPTERAELQAVLDQVPEQHRSEFAQAGRKIVEGSVQASVKKAVVLEALRASIASGQTPAREQIQLSTTTSLVQYLQKPSSEATGTSIEQLIEAKPSPVRESLKQEWQKLSEAEKSHSAASVKKALQNEAQIQKNTGLTEKEILKAAIATGSGKPLPQKWQKLSISEAQDWQDLISVNVTSPTNDNGWEEFAALPMIEELSERVELQAVLDQVPQQHRAEFAGIAQKLLDKGLHSQVTKTDLLKAVNQSLSSGDPSFLSPITVTTVTPLAKYWHDNHTHQSLENPSVPETLAQTLETAWNTLSSEEQRAAVYEKPFVMKHYSTIAQSTGMKPQEIFKAVASLAQGKPLDAKLDRKTIVEEQSLAEYVAQQKQGARGSQSWGNLINNLGGVTELEKSLLSAEITALNLTPTQKTALWSELSNVRKQGSLGEYRAVLKQHLGTPGQAQGQEYPWDSDWELAFERAVLNLPETQKLSLRKQAEELYGNKIQSRALWENLEEQGGLVTGGWEQALRVELGQKTPRESEHNFAWGDGMLEMVSGWDANTQELVQEQLKALHSPYTEQRQFWNGLRQSLPPGATLNRGAVSRALNESIQRIKTKELKRSGAGNKPGSRGTPGGSWERLSPVYRSIEGTSTAPVQGKDFGVPMSRARIIPAGSKALSQSQGSTQSLQSPKAQGQSRSSSNLSSSLPIVPLEPSLAQPQRELYSEDGSYRKRALVDIPQASGAKYTPRHEARYDSRDFEGNNNEKLANSTKHQRIEQRYEQDKQVVMRKESSGVLGGIGGSGTTPLSKKKFFSDIHDDLNQVAEE